MCDKELNPYIFKIGVRSQEKEGVRSQESGERRSQESGVRSQEKEGRRKKEVEVREYNFYLNQFPNHQLPITNYLKKKQIGGSEVSNCYNQT
ncbi:hypothetical protein FJR06_05430 [Dolichospermum sp. UHCC 0352]|uniref:hypothetical protein n=1 Tax=Dolichospermum sp. UHCC 0352 TaxID=2590011 RepID=UPI001444C52B|nr:hypothetical protein [Dolichospermum sp. UHCC 0352]MTJ20801.1 hypothetical protein [Dolichospermum sp. UHCC 0352]